MNETGTGLILPATMPLRMALQVATQRNAEYLLIAPIASPKKDDAVTLITQADLATAAQANPNAALGSLVGPTVYITAINPDKTASWSVSPPAAAQVGPGRGLGDSKGADVLPSAPPQLVPGPPQAENRVVNAAIYYADEPPDVVPANVSLALESRYKLRVNIGARQQESRLAANSPTINTPEIDEKGLDLFVSVTTRGNAVQFAAPTQVLHLPQIGDSAPINFSFIAKQTASDVPLWIQIYYNWVLLQTIEMHVAVTTAEQDLPAPLPTTVVYNRTAGFADLEALRPNEVVLRMWHDGDGYRVNVAWPGDGEAANKRRDPARGLAVALPVNAQDFANVIGAARNLLYDTTWQASYRQSVRGTLKERRESLYHMAVAGNRLYATLFHPSSASGEQAESLRALRQWLDVVGTVAADATRPGIQIIHDNMPSGIPWGLLYPDPVREASEVDARKFWGCRYRLEVLTPQLAENAQTPPAPRNAVRIVGGTYNFRVPVDDGTVIEVTAEHRKALTAWNNNGGRWSVDLREQADQNSLATLLNDGDVVYMFCHGHTAKTPDDTSDWVARFKDQMAKLSSDIKAKYGDLLKLEKEGYQPSDPNIGDSWLQWNSSLLPLRLLSQWSLKLPRKPLVILNMCESAQVLPTLQAGFIPFFSQLGARGVLGTECPMLAPFAAAFGQKLLEKLAAGEKIGDILPALRLHFIEEERNPLGLAYTYYGDADVSF